MEHLARQREITKAKPRDRNKGSTFKLRRFVVLHDKRVFIIIPYSLASAKPKLALQLEHTFAMIYIIQSISFNNFC